MTKPINIYMEWIAANRDTWYTTRSLYSSVPCYISPVALPTCRNYSSNLSARALVGDVKDYLEQQVLILKFNNPGHTPLMVKAAINSRMVYWKGNDILKKDAYFLRELLDSIIEYCFDGGSSIPIRNIDETQYWYSDEIAKMSGKGIQSSDRTKAKQKARYAVMSGGTKDDLRVASLDYRCNNFDILPTVKALVNETPYSRNTVIKHGEGFYIPRVKNIGQRVEKAREVYPEHTQQIIADLIGESKRTVREYWRIEQGDENEKYVRAGVND